MAEPYRRPSNRDNISGKSGRAAKPSGRFVRPAQPRAPATPRSPAPAEYEPLLSSEPLLSDEPPAPPPVAPRPRPSSRVQPQPSAAAVATGSQRLRAPAPAAPKVPPAPPPEEEEEAPSDEEELEEAELDELEEAEPEPAPEPPPARSSQRTKPAADSTAKGSSRRTAGQARSATTESEEPAEEDEPVAASTRTTQRLKLSAGQKVKGSTSRTTRRLEEPEDTDTRRTTRKSMRGAAPQGLAIPKKYIVLGSAGVLLLLIVMVGYGPFMGYLRTKTLDEGTSLEERKNAAAALFEQYHTGAFNIFAVRADRSDPILREAATYGLELLGTRSSFHPQVIERLKDALPGADTAGKLLYIRALASISQLLVEQRGEGKLAESKAKAETESINKTAQVLIPLAQQTDLDLEVRSAAVDGLVKLRAPGVCRTLVKLASAPKDGVRDRARAGIAPTALPEACGALLKAMAGTDKDLATFAKMGFVRVRDEAESNDLLPLVSDPSPEVRREIVDALGKRRGDGVAAKGVTIALKDKAPDIRVLALKAIPCTGLDGATTQLAALVADPDESVRIANAETLAEMRDDESKKVILAAFKNNLEGKTLDAYIRALGRRSAGSAKDLKSIGMVMEILESTPGAVASIREALVYLTSAGQGSEREAQRRQWEAAKWKAWYANITTRDKIRAEAAAKIKATAAQKDADRSLFPGFYEDTKQAIVILEKAKEMCKPDDPEDTDGLDREIHSATRQQDYFFRSSGVR